MCLTLVVGRVHAQYYSVNYDKQTVAAMAAAFGAGTMAESYYNEQVGAVLKHYNAAEVATAGIFAAKFLERKAFTDLGIWSSNTENYYYRRIHNMMANKIMPKIWTVASMMLKSPQTALHWGSYLMKICADTKSLCMQFESVVTNSSLTFADIQFLEINQEIAAILKLSEIGNMDWQQLLDDIASVPGNFTVENLTADINTLYNMGASLATAGIGSASDALLQKSAFNELFNGKVSKIIDIYDNYHNLYEQAENGIGNALLGLVGGEDNVAGLFNLSNYNITSWMTDYLSGTQGNYYTQRWYIARRDQGSVNLCDYYPPTDDNSIINGDHWTRFNTSDANFYPNSTQREQVLVNSENHAGWSRSRVQQLNAQNDGFTYSMSYWMSSYIISKKNRQTKTAMLQNTIAAEFTKIHDWENKYNSYLKTASGYASSLKACTHLYDDGVKIFITLGKVRKAISHNPQGTVAALSMNNLYMETATELVSVFTLLKDAVAKGGTENMLTGADRSKTLWALNDKLGAFSKKLHRLYLSIRYYTMTDVWNRVTAGMTDRSNGEIAMQALGRWRRAGRLTIND